MSKIIVVFTLLSALLAWPALAHQPVIVGDGGAVIADPETSRAFYGELAGEPAKYILLSKRDFNLYLNLLVPKPANTDARYSLDVFLINGQGRKLLGTLDGNFVIWTEFHEPFAGDDYLKGPELRRFLPAGQYEIIVSGNNNFGKYVLAVGEDEAWGAKELLSSLIVLPQLKLAFFRTSPFNLFFTPLGILYFLFAALLLAAGVIIIWLLCSRKRANG